MGNFNAFFEHVKPVSLSDILVDVEDATEDFIIFRIHCKYDTQATADEIIEKLKALDKLNEGIALLEKEINTSKLDMESLPEYNQEYIKAYLDGLHKAWRIIHGNK